MANTTFYNEVNTITWKDIFSESFKKHNGKELEHALLAGTSYDTALTGNMLQKWNKPWIWTRVLLLLGGMGFIFYVSFMSAPYDAFAWCSLLFLTMATPLTTMMIAWEMNIPRNISIFNILFYFLIGGVMSLIFTSILNIFKDSDAEAWLAPFTEEPAKLIAALIILYLLKKNGKEIYGLTGLTVGAGVGTGFTVFESFGYVLDSVMEGGYSYALSVVKYRSIPMLNAHMVYCTIYTAMIALQFHRTKDWKESILNKQSLWMIAFSVADHAIWNSEIFVNSYSAYWLKACAIAVVSFIVLLKIVRECVKQAVDEGRRTGRYEDTTTYAGKVEYDYRTTQNCVLYVISSGEILNGTNWVCRNSTLVGRGEDCGIRFYGNVPGLSRNHCMLNNHGNYWTIVDLNSSYGTYINGQRLQANMEYKLNQNCDIFLGSNRVKITVSVR